MIGPESPSYKPLVAPVGFWISKGDTVPVQRGESRLLLFEVSSSAHRSHKLLRMHLGLTSL